MSRFVDDAGSEPPTAQSTSGQSLSLTTVARVNVSVAGQLVTFWKTIFSGYLLMLTVLNKTVIVCVVIYLLV